MKTKMIVLSFVLISVSLLNIAKAGDNGNICTLPAKPGFCRGHIPRWAYDSVTKKCTEFIYGGCCGNNNNFMTEEQCNKWCPPGEY